LLDRVTATLLRRQNRHHLLSPHRTPMRCDETPRRMHRRLISL